MFQSDFFHKSKRIFDNFALYLPVCISIHGCRWSFSFFLSFSFSKTTKSFRYFFGICLYDSLYQLMLFSQLFFFVVVVIGRFILHSATLFSVKRMYNDIKFFFRFLINMMNKGGEKNPTHTQNKNLTEMCHNLYIYTRRKCLYRFPFILVSHQPRIVVVVFFCFFLKFRFRWLLHFFLSYRRWN